MRPGSGEFQGKEVPRHVQCWIQPSRTCAEANTLFRQLQSVLTSRARAIHHSELVGTDSTPSHFPRTGTWDAVERRWNASLPSTGTWDAVERVPTKPGVQI